MGFLDSLFGNKKSKETALLRAEIERMRSEFLKNSLDAKSDINQIITVLAEFDQEIRDIREYVKAERDSKDSPETILKAISNLNTISSKNEKTIDELKNRVADFEKIAATLKVMGKLSIRNYDGLKLMDVKVKKLDAIEKNLLEHIKSTPEAVVSKDDYFEELRSLKKRLDALENSSTFLTPQIEEKILISPEKKRQKKQVI